ncbi:hypothetical protein CYY_008257 [Polysphondylium violaceum]|uniref:NADP-dependent oxidoreductase domain-containing protein n=1 Tax=Polysphondylium violaceum TaxID=133409 RepID=A0A8J4PQN9_9MYCE|nr:hypothetical protein CYY_008257 [Polysphondylium violaceum]
MIKNIFTINNTLKLFSRHKNGFIYFSSSSMSLNGATSLSTENYFKKLNNNNNSCSSPVKLPKLSWNTSKYALNTDYLTIYETQHKATLLKAIKNGCNVIVTRNNSATISPVISDLIENKEIERASIVVIKRSMLSKSISDLSCDQIDKDIKESLDKLGLDHLDVYMVDLSTFIQIDDQLINHLFENIFPHLESLIVKGQLSSYGLSFNQDSITNQSKSIESIIMKRKENNCNNFSFIQYPFNIYQHQTITNSPYHNGTKNIMEYAKENELVTLNSSPSLFTTPSLQRFKSVRDHSNVDIEKILKESFDLTIHMERNNPITKDESHSNKFKENKDLIGSLTWGHTLIYERSNPKLANLWSWKQILSSKIRPLVLKSVFTLFSSNINNNWGNSYLRAINSLFETYTKSLELQIFDQQRDMDQSFENHPYFKNIKITDQKQQDSTTSTSTPTPLSLYQKSLLVASKGADIIVEDPSNEDDLKEIQSIPFDSNPINNNQIIELSKKVIIK